MAYSSTVDVLKTTELLTNKLFTGFGFLKSLEINYTGDDKKLNIKIFTGMDDKKEFMFDILISGSLGSLDTSKGTYKICNLTKNGEVISAGNIQFGPIFKLSNLYSLLIQTDKNNTIKQSFYYKDDEGLKEVKNDSELKKSLLVKLKDN